MEVKQEEALIGFDPTITFSDSDSDTDLYSVNVNGKNYRLSNHIEFVTYVDSNYCKFL